MDNGLSANHIILGKKYTSINNMVRGFIYEKSLTMIVSCSQALCMSQWRCVKCTVKKQVRDRGEVSLCVSGHNGEACTTIVSHHSHVSVCTPPPSLLYHSQPIGPYRLCMQAQQ